MVVVRRSVIMAVRSRAVAVPVGTSAACPGHTTRTAERWAAVARHARHARQARRARHARHARHAGRNSSAAAGSTTVEHVRVTYRAGTPAGETPLRPCVYVNEPDGQPFQGTTFCSRSATVELSAAEPATPTTPASSAVPAAPASSAIPTAPADAAAPTVPALSATPVTPAAAAPAASTASGELAHTGANGADTTLLAGLAAVLAGAGTVVLVLFRRRRHTS